MDWEAVGVLGPEGVSKGSVWLYAWLCGRRWTGPSVVRVTRSVAGESYFLRFF